MRRLLLGRHRRPADDAPDALRERLLAVMQEPGCPVCRLAREQERRYFFWFFAENYHAPETLRQLAASHGFCHLHASRLAVRGQDRASAIAVVYELISRRVAGELASAAGRDRPGWPVTPRAACPACVSRARSEHRSLEALAELLRDGRERERYRAPQLLCHTHLRGLEPLLGAADLGRVVGLHLAWLDGVLRADADGAGTSRDAQGLGGLVQDVDIADLLPSHRAAEAGPRDVEGAVDGALPDGRRCPLCAALTDAYVAWEGYCEAHAAGVSAGDAGAVRDEPGDDLLPTCDVHVSAYLAHGGPALRRLTLQNLGGRVRGALHRTLELLRTERPRSRLARLFAGDEAPEARARRALSRDVACPVCAMLATTEARALALFGPLVRSGPGSERYARGHGLCLRHLRAALPRSAAPARVLLEHARVDVELLAWRLREAGRLDAWNTRPLPAPTGARSWQRALYRYVGGPV